MKNKKQILFLLLSAVFVLGACEKKDSASPENPNNNVGNNYIIAVSPIASEGVADYLLTTNDLTSGTITTQGNGIEQDGSYRYYVTHKNKFFSLLYGQGNPGAVTTYQLDQNGNLTKSSNFQTETVQVFTPVNDDLLLIKVPRSGDANGLMYRIDAEKSIIVAEKQINIVDIAGNGERAHFTWATQVRDKVFAPYMSIKGCCDDSFGTSFPDSSWIAVLSYPELEVEKVIRDNRTSYIGAYFTNGLLIDEKEDVYGFSPAAASNGGIKTSKNPSAIVKIKAGTTEFDQDYFFNVQEATGGYHIQGQTYFGKGKVLLHLYGSPHSFIGSKFAIADLYAKTISWVTGVPDNLPPVDIKNTLASDNGEQVYVGLTLTDGSSYVYSFDVNTAIATKGLKVEGGTITSIQMLKND